MKVQVVMGLTQGVLDTLFVTTDEKAARRAVRRFDKSLGIERESDGHYEHDENDVWWRETTVRTPKKASRLMADGGSILSEAEVQEMLDFIARAEDKGAPLKEVERVRAILGYPIP